MQPCCATLIRRQSKAFRPSRRRRCRPGRGPSTRRKRTPKPPFSPARRLPASTPSSAKTRPGRAFSAAAWRSASPRRTCAAPAARRTRPLCATRFTSAGRGAIPDPRESSFSPAGSLAGVRPGSGAPRLTPPPGFSGFLTTKRWKRPSRRPRPAPPPPGRRPLPPRALSSWRGAR